MWCWMIRSRRYLTYLHTMHSLPWVAGGTLFFHKHIVDKTNEFFLNKFCGPSGLFVSSLAAFDEAKKKNTLIGRVRFFFVTLFVNNSLLFARPLHELHKYSKHTQLEGIARRKTFGKKGRCLAAHQKMELWSSGALIKNGKCRGNKWENNHAIHWTANA